MNQSPLLRFAAQLAADQDLADAFAAGSLRHRKAMALAAGVAEPDADVFASKDAHTRVAALFSRDLGVPVTCEATCDAVYQQWRRTGDFSPEQ